MLTKKDERFIDYLRGNAEACAVAARLVREGVNLQRVLGELQIYILGPSVAEQRRKNRREDSKIINKGVRDHGLTPEIGRWLLDRAEVAHSVNGLGRVHNTDSLGSLHIYLEAKTVRKVSMSELAYLVDAANWALERKPTVSDPKNLQHELARWRKNNPRFVEILTADIKSKL